MFVVSVIYRETRVIMILANDEVAPDWSRSPFPGEGGGEGDDWFAKM